MTNNKPFNIKLQSGSLVSYLKCWVPAYITHANGKPCFPCLPSVCICNNFAMSCGYCFSIIEFWEDFICLKTFQENNMSNSIIIRQLMELKPNKQKYWVCP